jgi:hypothetical protein
MVVRWSEMVDTLEKRRYPRAKAPKGLIVAWEAGTRRSVSFIENLALGGLFIRTKEPAPVASPLGVMVEAPTGDFRARAIVRRITPAKGMGIEFIAMSPEDRARLNKLLAPLLVK